MKLALRTALRAASRSIGLVVGGFMTLAGSVLGVNGAMDWQAAERVQQQSVLTEATVLAKSIERARDEPGSRTRYLVAYRFVAGQSGTIERSQEVPVETWERIDAGAPYSVSYLPHDPQADVSKTVDQRVNGQVASGLGGLFALIGFVVLIPALRRVLRVFTLASSGVPGEAMVLELWPTGTTINRVNYWQLSYEYRDALGQKRQGESGLLHPDEAATWAAGDRGQVRIDCVQGELSAWIGRPEPETAPGLLAALGAKLWGILKTLLGLAVMLAIVFAAAVIAEIPTIRELGAAIDARKGMLTVVTAGMLIAGFLLFMGGILWLIVAQGRPMSQGEIEDTARSVRMEAQPTTWRAGSYRIFGAAIGREAADSFSAREIGPVLRQGLLFHDPVWRRRLVVLAGVVLMVPGLCGLFVVIGPNWLKVLMSGALIYMAYRIVRGLLR